MSNQPVYRRPRSHAYSCRCPRCAPKGDFVARNGILGPGFLILCAVAVIGFWPAMVWHGYTDTGGWRWDIHSTIAEGVYFGVIAFILVLCGLGNRPAKAAPPSLKPSSPGPLPRSAVPLVPPACRHLHAGPLVNRFALSPVGWYCADCDTGLPAEHGNLARPCCGSAPGTLHQYNCPEG